MLLFLAILAFNTTKAQLSIDTTGLMEAYLQSEYIFEGIVTSQCTYEDEGHNIYTTNIIQITKIVKGNLTCGTVSLVTMGGTHDGSNLTIDHQIQFNPGVIGMYLCNNLAYPYSNCESPSNTQPLMLTYGEYGSFEYLFDLVNNEVVGFNSEFPTIESFYSFLHSIGINVIDCNLTSIQEIRNLARANTIKDQIVIRKPVPISNLESNLTKNAFANKALSKTGETIEYAITKASLSGSGSNQYYDVDISVKSNVNTTFLDGVSFRLKYNVNTFGTNISSVTTAQLGNNLDPSYYDNIGKFDFKDSILQVSIFNISFGTPNRVQLTTNLLKVINLRIPVTNCKYFPNFKIDTFSYINAFTRYALSTDSPRTYIFSDYKIGAFRQGNVCEPIVTNLSKDTVAGGIKETFVIYGNSFGSAKGKVYMTTADAVDSQFYALDTYDYVWNDNQITVTTPAFADSGYYTGIAYTKGTVGSGLIKIVDAYGHTYIPTSLPNEPSKIQVKHVVWNQTNGTGVNRYKNNEFLYSTNSDGKYHFKLSSNITDVGMINCIKAALRRWSCSTGVPFVLDNGTVSTPTNSVDSDGVNIIRLLTYPLNSKALATAYLRSPLNCSSSNTIAFPTSELDISINSAYLNDFQYDTTGNSDINTGKYDFYSVILHEIGHCHLLGHVNNSKDVMFRTSLKGPLNSINRKLNFNSYNLQAGDYIVNNSAITNNGIICSNKLPIVIQPMNCRNTTIGINEIKNSLLNFNVYPNPFQNKLNFSLKSQLNQNCEISIINNIGKTISSVDKFLLYGENNFNISNLELSDGIYYITIKTEHDIYSTKIVCIK